ncbi:EpsG family protein [uncultured Clostridium sp.]|jgi:hypothetical protein|uniref:EpsG family protein n=1 Tax=uncultured Clostridium sp. TaxID=59620 RepID=UPI00260EFDF7|nr:EpsG family protein [uncultured Clostridium sp.]
MEIYIFFAIIIFSLIIYLINSILLDKIWWVIVFFALLYFLSVQGLVSPDRQRYIEYYVDTGLGMHRFVYEKGFMILNKYMYQVVGINFNVVFMVYYVIMATFFTLGLKYMAKIKREYMFIVLLVFANTILPASIIIRQFTAIAICLFSIKIFFEKKYIKFTILIILTSFLHATAPIYLGACFLYIFLVGKFKTRYKILGVAGLIISGYLVIQINYINMKLIAYTNTQGMVDRNKFGLLLILFLVIMITYIIIISIKKIKFKNEYQKFNLFMGIIFFIMYIGFYKYGFMSRIAYYFQVFMYAVIIDFICLIENQYMRIIGFIIYSLVILVLGIKMY